MSYLCWVGWTHISDYGKVHYLSRRIGVIQTIRMAVSCCVVSQSIAVAAAGHEHNICSPCTMLFIFCTLFCGSCMFSLVHMEAVNFRNKKCINLLSHALCWLQKLWEPKGIHIVNTVKICFMSKITH